MELNQYSMRLQWTPWVSMELPWNSTKVLVVSMEPHGTPWSFHETPWNSMELPWSSMEFHGASMELHIIPWSFHGTPWGFHRIPWNSMKLHGILWNSMELFYTGSQLMVCLWPAGLLTSLCLNCNVSVILKSPS